MSMEYLEEIKNKIKDSTKTQKIAAFFLILSLILAGIYMYNPQKKLLEMRNSTRRTDVNKILNATYQYSASNEGNLPFTVSSQPTMICKSKAVSCEGMVDLSLIIKESKLLSEVPVDPLEKKPNSSGYQIFKNASGRLSVTAPLAENKAVIILSK